MPERTQNVHQKMILCCSDFGKTCSDFGKNYPYYQPRLITNLGSISAPAHELTRRHPGHLSKRIVKRRS